MSSPVLCHWCNTGRGRGQVPTLVAHLMWRPTPLMMLPRQPLSACEQTGNSVSIFWQYRRCHTIWAFRLADDDQPCQKLWQSPGCIHQFGDLLPCLRRCHEQIPLAGFCKNVWIENRAEVSIECCEYWREPWYCCRWYVPFISILISTTPMHLEPFVMHSALPARPQPLVRSLQLVEVWSYREEEEEEEEERPEFHGHNAGHAIQATHATQTPHTDNHVAYHYSNCLWMNDELCNIIWPRTVVLL